MILFSFSILSCSERIMKWDNKLKEGYKNLPPVFNFLLLKKAQHTWDFFIQCASCFVHFIKLTLFLTSKYSSCLIFGWLLMFLSFFYDSRLYLLSLGAFSIFFLSVKSLQLERPARTFYTDQWSIFTSNELFEKAKGPVVLSDCAAARGRKWKVVFLMLP